MNKRPTRFLPNQHLTIACLHDYFVWLILINNLTLVNINELQYGKICVIQLSFCIFCQFQPVVALLVTVPKKVK